MEMAMVEILTRETEQAPFTNGQPAEIDPVTYTLLYWGALEQISFQRASY
jgi:hypothetical protein